MSDNFTVIKGKAIKENANKIMWTLAFHDCWKRQYHSFILQAVEKNKDMRIADYPQNDLMKISFAGIKYINSIHKIRKENERISTNYTQTFAETQEIFQSIDAILTVCSYLTLRNFVTTFPIDKDYSGKKWECKDYFYTMNVLSKMDWEKPIGKDELLKLLWDYENTDLRYVFVEFTMAMSAIYRAQTGKGIAETWCDNWGISTYTKDRETGIIKNNQTGDIIKPKKASHIQIIK